MIKSAYIHIPFCTHICSYCDFCKMFYNKQLVAKYLKELNKEISNNYKNEVLDTIYIGGGTPSSLSYLELKQLFEICSIFKINTDYEFTIECNIENITEEKLKLMKNNRVNRISIGVESFNDKNLEFMERHHTKDEIINTLSLVKKYFHNINIDLIYAIPNQTLTNLKDDLKEFINLDIPHISTYSLIIEDNTKLGVNNILNIDEDTDYEMYKYITKELEQYDYIHYETSNFAKQGYESKHNLTYWNNESYYGFGLGASGFINNKRYDNTKSINKYLIGKHCFTINEMSKLDNMQNEMILGLRKKRGVSKKAFLKKYSQTIEETFDIAKLIKDKKLIDDENNIYISEQYTYLANEILIYFI